MTKRKNNKLIAIITNRSAGSERLWSALVITCISAIVAIFAYWFWGAVGEEMQGNSFIPRLATLGAYIASIGGLTSALLLLIRQPVADRLVTIASQVAIVCGIAMAVNTVVYILANSEGARARELFESFIDFNRVEIGSFGFSITGTLTVIAIALAIAAASKNKNNK